MNYRYLLTCLGILLVSFGLIEGGWFLVAAWLGCDFLILGIAHLREAHVVFGKRADGSLPWWSWLLFFPFHMYGHGVWYLIRLLSPEPACDVVTEHLVVGRRLLPSELDGEFENYVDLTAEFAEPKVIRRSASYRCFPILDGAAPTPDALRQAVSSLRPGRTFVHCAQGHGRTGLFALALLLSSGVARTVEDGLRMLTSARPGICLNREQRRCVETFAVLAQAASDATQRSSDGTLG